VGAVVVVRYGFNPLEAIKNVKAKIAEIAPGLDTKAVVDYEKVGKDTVQQFAKTHGFEGYVEAQLNQDAWLDWLRSTPREEWPEWVTTSQVTIVPFYDRTGLIYETLGTLRTALTEEILVTIIVVVVSVLHLRSSLLISTSLPLAVLMCFIFMKGFGVDANIVALSGIAIAIGTIVDMSIIICENILRHLDEAEPDEDRLEVVFRAASEVGGAVLTAVATTVISFLPVFFMTGAEGKLFKPLAFTKTFALIASIIVALTIVPPGVHLLIARRVESKKLKVLALAGLVAAGIVFWASWGWWIAGPVMIVLGLYHMVSPLLPGWGRKLAVLLASAAAVAIVGVLLTQEWEPLGPEKGLWRNLTFVGGLIGGLLLFFYLFRQIYAPILRWCLNHKIIFMVVPAATVALGAFAWMGVEPLYGPMDAAPAEAFASQEEMDRLAEADLIEPRGERLLWTPEALGTSRKDMAAMLEQNEVQHPERVLESWERTRQRVDLRSKTWGPPDNIQHADLGTQAEWTVARHWDGLGKEFMPPLDEGSYLLMPTTMPHASIGECLDVLQTQDRAIRAIPEIRSVVGKIGRVDSPLDPAPISMVETVIMYKPEYVTDKAGHRVYFRYDEEAEEFVRDEDGELVEDRSGRPYRQWRDHIESPDDIWEEILDAAEIPGTTSAPKLQPIKARIVMLQSGMRAPMGVKVRGPDLETIEKVALDIERLLKQVPSVEPATVVADRIVGKPYLEIDIDRQAIARYGLHIRKVQNVIEVAIGGRKITTTVEGRERYPVRVRYQRELRDQIDTLGRILVPAPDGTQIPLTQLAEIRYVRGPQVIKSEDTFLVGYVVFDKKDGFAEVDVVEECQAYLNAKRQAGEFAVPAGVSYKFAGSYENQIRARKTLSIVLPLALFVIFMILYFQFHSVPTTFLVFSGILVAWAGGFILIWLYDQPWFMNFTVYGVPMRELFQIHTVNLSVAVWVGFLALFGIASDNGVVIATYLDQSFRARQPESIEQMREATVVGAVRRIRPCLMTSATTILALLPVLTSTGRGSDVMVPMAIPSFGGMLVVLVSVFAVPVLYCLIQEMRFRAQSAVTPDTDEA
jgi:Cu(I)/Ag(I) efflux system membrane protein CusA/SilA